MTHARADLRLGFARNALKLPLLQLVSASSDASFRSYWRTVGATPERIVMDAPPDREDLGPWLDVAERLQRAGLSAPRVLAQDLGNGFLLISDLGNSVLLLALNPASVEHHYAEAMRAVLTMQTAIDASDLPAYDEARLVSEMELLPTWFLQRHLKLDIACEQWDIIELAFRALLINAQVQPQRFVHRDFHSRNLMLGERGLSIIDFQDAVRGPITYDLVSLLRDCYIEWPRSQVEAWADSYRQQAIKANLTDADRARFLRWFDLMGLQRHIKVLGIFCRLFYRDGKAGYLGDLPMVWRYTRDVGRRYPEIAPLIELIEVAIGRRDVTQPV